ncbi:MAG: dihydrodipicolinate synthase family protein [Terriglobia bacterium]|jgi:dihydrodipicolinate synthase/N-acetylneuraminate lyase|nr:dihydrodipicolinate synthase family protein [Terriglobia bacterium]
MLLSGLFPPITTPFYPDGKIYYKKLEHNVDRYSKTPIAGIVVQGSTGEALMLSDEEKREVLRVAMGAAAPEKVMIAGCGIESAFETLRLIEYAASLDYDVAMIRTPHYYKSQLKPENMLAFYRFVADRSPLPIMIYSFPPSTGYDIPAEVVIALAEHPNLLAIKESSGVIEKVKRMVDETRHIRRSTTVTERFEPVTARMLKKANSVAAGELVPAAALVGAGGSIALTKPSSSAVQVVGNLKTRQKEIGFQVLVGSAQKFLLSLEVGAVGSILAFADAAPTACYEIYAAYKDGDKKLAQEKQERIAKAATRVVGELSVPGVKYAMDLNGYYGGNGRLPLLPLSGEVKQEIERLMENIKN